jgi:hypothetical protein
MHARHDCEAFPALILPTTESQAALVRQSYATLYATVAFAVVVTLTSPTAAIVR